MSGSIGSELEEGSLTRQEIYARLQQLYDYYAEREGSDEREAVADVLDCFDGWSPRKAAL